MNKPIRVLAVGCALLFGALLVNANYVQFVQADELNDRADNRRVVDAEYSRERGPIFVAGEAVAESKPVDDQYDFQRAYGPNPRIYSHLTGFYSYLYGASGVEQTENDILSGSDPRLLFNRVIDLVTEEQPKGGNVLLTIDPAAQAAAHHGLSALTPKGAKGAVVALRPDTGEVLAMASLPDFDPNVMASHDFASTEDAWKRLTEDPAEPLLNRAVQGRYPPGSTFKLVVTAAALESGQYTPESMVTGQALYTLPNTEVQLGNDGRGSCGGEQITLTRALAFSCNTSFAKLGAEDLGAEALREQAQDFGFGQDVFDGLPNSATSVFPEDPDDPQTALSSIGQFEVAATPLQMAMVVAGIANEGTVMKPYLVAEERSPDLDTLEKTEPEALSQAVSSSVAADLRQMMVEVTDSGTGSAAAIPGIEVGSKTGTAESADERDPYAWFVAFGPADDPEVAVAVFVEDANVPRSEISGGGLAGPIAKSVMEAVIKPVTR